MPRLHRPQLLMELDAEPPRIIDDAVLEKSLKVGMANGADEGVGGVRAPHRDQVHEVARPKEQAERHLLAARSGWEYNKCL